MAGPEGQPGPRTAGLFGSLRELLSSLLETAQLRLELLSNEFHREKLRIFDGLVWAALALVFVGLGLLLLAGLLLVLTPEPWRLLLLGLLVVLSLGLGVWMMVQARRRLSQPAGVLPASRAELASDLDALRSPH